MLHRVDDFATSFSSLLCFSFDFAVVDFVVRFSVFAAAGSFSFIIIFFFFPFLSISSKSFGSAKATPRSRSPSLFFAILLLTICPTILPFSYASLFLSMNRYTALFDRNAAADVPCSYSPVLEHDGNGTVSPFSSNLRNSNALRFSFVVVACQTFVRTQISAQSHSYPTSFSFR